MPNKLLRIPEVAHILDVQEARVYEMARAGILPRGVVVRLGRQLRVDEARFRQWLAAGGQPLAGGWRRAANRHKQSVATT